MKLANLKPQIFTNMLKSQQYIRSGNFKVYAPNAFDKQSCDPNWTDVDHPCRGTKATCRYANVITDSGLPTNDCCWRYSFRNQLKEAKATGGFLLQLVESENPSDKFMAPELGKGQEIERRMAQNLHMKIFRVYRPTGKNDKLEFGFSNDSMTQIVSCIKLWYDNGCQDQSECVVHPVLL